MEIPLYIMIRNTVFLQLWPTERAYDEASKVGALDFSMVKSLFPKICCKFLQFLERPLTDTDSEQQTQQSISSIVYKFARPDEKDVNSNY